MADNRRNAEPACAPLEDARARPSALEPPAAKPRPSKRVPPLWIWLLLLVVGGTIVYVRTRNPTGDHAVTNIVTLLLAFVGALVLATWFVLLSGYSRAVRIGSAVSMVAAITVLFTFYRIRHVSGEMVPVFGLRFAPSADELLEIPHGEGEPQQCNLATTTPNDFPQFLGPDRRQHTDAVKLATRWTDRPPKLLWRQPIGAGWSAFAAVNGYAVTLEQRGEQELVTCYQVASGELIWSFGVAARHSTTLGGIGPRSTPTIHAGRVYSLGAAGDLLCLDGATGRLIWRENLLQRYRTTPEQDAAAVAWGRASSPLIVDQLVVVPAGGPPGGPCVSLVALDRDTGSLVWEGGDRQISYASPALATLAGVRQILTVNEDNVSAHDPADGHLLWQYDWAGKSNANANASQPVVIDENHVLLSKGYGGGALLLNVTVADSGRSFVVREVWHHAQLLKTKFTNLSLHSGHAFGLSDGILECIEVLPGRRKWKQGRYGHGQILGVGDVLLVQAEDGRIALVATAPDEYRELGDIPALDGKTWNNLCLFGPYLLARNSEQACCFELPLAKD